MDVIAGKRDKANGEVEKRIVSQMLTLMDGLTADKNIMVVAGAPNPQPSTPNPQPCPQP